MRSLWKLSLGYFFCYICTGVIVKLFTGKVADGFLGLNTLEYLVYSTVFSSLFCVSLVLILGWHKRGKLQGSEQKALFISGACTAYIIPAGTLIYSLPISIMIAMVLMRGSVIVASRIVDFILEIQGLHHKKIPWQEELAVVMAMGAVGTKLFFTPSGSTHFPLSGVLVLTLYFLAYLIRLFIMNRAKLLGVAGKQLDQQLYFGIEQICASSVLFAVTVPLFFIVRSRAGASHIGQQFVAAVELPNVHWLSAAFSGLPYAFIAFLSVFLFLYPGKSATFTGVLNRLVSLLGGTASSLVLYFAFSGPFPPREDWWALLFIVASIVLLAWGDSVEVNGLRKCVKSK